MISKLSNGEIEVKIDNNGAQMTSLQFVEENTEYLWEADPDHWGRHAPVLFPIVGKLEGDQYQLNDETFALTQHGFARDNKFEIVSETEDQIIYRLSSKPSTLKKYPYKFELDISYKLEENKVKVKYVVRNKDEKKIYFSIGGHPGFNCPLEKGEEKEDYYLEFETAETVDRYLLEDGLLTNDTTTVLTDSKVIDLTPDLFKKDALVFKNLKSDRISLKSKISDRKVTVDFSGFPYLGIWSQSAKAPFVCIEPWYGIADVKGTSSNLKEKEGIKSLDPSAEFSCEYSIEIE